MFVANILKFIHLDEGTNDLGEVIQQVES